MLRVTSWIIFPDQQEKPSLPIYSVKHLKHTRDVHVFYIKILNTPLLKWTNDPTHWLEVSYPYKYNYPITKLVHF